MTKVTGQLKENFAFESNIDGHKVTTDATEAVGGKNTGPSPKKLLLAGLIGCTGIDVVSILKKMRVEPTNLIIEAEAESSNEHPKVYTSINLSFIFTGDNLPMDKLEKAVSLSQERYCAVAAMLKKASPIEYKILLEESAS
ncbi:MAG TPA: OsmC family protein [Bacillota bacterium]|nr:OsmC family protein [Bacillota bacterium]